MLELDLIDQHLGFMSHFQLYQVSQPSIVG